MNWMAMRWQNRCDKTKCAKLKEKEKITRWKDEERTNEKFKMKASANTQNIFVCYYILLQFAGWNFMGTDFVEPRIFCWLLNCFCIYSVHSYCLVVLAFTNVGSLCLSLSVSLFRSLLTDTFTHTYTSHIWTLDTGMIST